jgi:hypothetical protein
MESTEIIIENGDLKSSFVGIVFEEEVGILEFASYQVCSGYDGCVVAVISSV